MLRAFYIAGPTGSGKSAVALALADAAGPAEIVNADAFQVYERLDIVSAKPSVEERARCPHHLFSIVPPTEEFSAARFEAGARPVIDAIEARGHLPVVVGGTGLYLKALTHGLTNLPVADEGLRAQLAALPLEDLVAWFRRLDPEGAEKTNLANPRYVQRALEITLQTGRPMSAVKRDWEENAAPPPAFDGVVLVRDRDDLYDRINRRVPAMIDAGLIDEIRGLGDLSATAVKAIGIPEVRAHLAGEIDLEECVARIQQASRRFAKRQLTWFKKEHGFATLVVERGESAKSVAGRILERFPRLIARRSLG